jgi:hypothetical protein
MLIEIAGEVQLRTYGQFLDEYGIQLRGIEEALEDSMCGSWDMNLDPISLQVIYVVVFIEASVCRTGYHPAYSFNDSSFAKVVDCCVYEHLSLEL